ncbi:MAG TPA: competence type IV pilus minor pilin ComGF [Tetragenococcus sp.]|nr:competence type IV pilus minor pilin ComGF [Tetragenococcus sp.]
MKNKAFTLIECMVALLVMSVFLMGTLNTFKQSKAVTQSVYGRNRQEWYIFLIQLDNKLAEGHFSRVTPNKLYYNKKDEKTDKSIEGYIELRNNNKEIVIRESGGYEPILTEVSQLKFRQNPRYILFTVTFLNGEERNGKWIIE